MQNLVAKAVVTDYLTGSKGYLIETDRGEKYITERAHIQIKEQALVAQGEKHE